VFVTFEETPSDIRQNMLSFGWNIEQWEQEGKWAFVNVSPYAEDDLIVNGTFDLTALLVRIQHAIERVGASRVSLDSLGAVFGMLQERAIVRRELLRIGIALKKMGVTALLTAERSQEYGNLAQHGIEEFVADNVIILRNVLEDEKRRRTMEILRRKP